MPSRFLFFKTSCPACLEYLRIIPMLNLRLSREKQITLIDGLQLELFGVTNYPILKEFDPRLFNSYPLLYLDGSVIKGFVLAQQLKILLERFFKDDFIY